MVTVGAYEAKTHLARLLERVARGESVTITKHGRPVARLVPAEATASRPAEVIRALRKAREGVRGHGSIRQMIDDGRR